jgi:methyl-accepting chemotaxis protein
MISSIKVGKTGSAMLLDSQGTYLYCSDPEKVANGVLITNDDNHNLAAMGQEIMTRDSTSPQMGAFMENGKNILTLSKKMEFQ